MPLVSYLNYVKQKIIYWDNKFDEMEELRISISTFLYFC